MTTTDLTQAREALARLDGKALDEAAKTYLLGTLDIDLDDEVTALWHASFADPDEDARAKKAVDELLADPERAELLRLAMLMTLEERPDTAQLFVESVDQAGQSLFIVELAAVTLAAALLIREYHRKGRSHEVHRTEITEPDGRKTVQIDEVRYADDGPLASLLDMLGLWNPGA
ncbi:hypothetical protein GCM10010313_82900 [Streptomyces violarus]|uniref:Uncharacterized protein n=1 Tax=Streptomyces violarus TaxID=67380 RepID=A0A7W4ZZQ7_9ACTN|nr:hypothetical protein [Streptomyces violarus]MBB3081758.1 hypothetical protein [Streptomyces violarus]GHD35503.1 hypothetical protein GCM10010313_82900 [Streptomyces violarus]